MSKMERIISEIRENLHSVNWAVTPLTPPQVADAVMWEIEGRHRVCRAQWSEATEFAHRVSRYLAAADS